MIMINKDMIIKIDREIGVNVRLHRYMNHIILFLRININIVLRHLF